MKTRPILFSGPMIRALLEGRKTQTRRVVKPAFGKRYPILNLKEHGIGDYSGEFNDPASWGYPCAEDGNDMPLAYWLDLCPYGKRGDLLWVREAFAIRVRPEEATDGRGRAWYTADDRGQNDLRWSPSIHMPRWASRLTLEITEVRVQRLQDISDPDKDAEGGTADRPFGTVWRVINTAPGIRWEDNPWVWALSLRVHQENVDAFLKGREAA